MDLVALIGGWLLVWAFGVALVAALPASGVADSAGERAYVIGCGWFVGQYLVTLWRRVLALGSIPFGIASIGLPMLAAAIAAGWLGRRRLATSRIAHTLTQAARAAHLSNAQRLLWRVLLVWLVVRFGLLLSEVLQRPLYPWDAWTQWSTKARVWYALRTMVPFGSASDWIAATSGAPPYFDAAPHYPGTVPLTQVWSATLIGRWDDALINLPWWLTGVAFGFALYALLRKRHMEPLAALLGTWLVLSLPILNVHVALAGYADISMATYFALTTLVGLQYVQLRAPRDLMLALLFASACVVIKNPGIVWLLTLFPGLVVGLFPRHGMRFAAASFAVAALVALVLTQHGMTILGYRLQLDYDMPWRALADAWFAYANWHLLFYGALLVIVVGWRQLLSPELAPLTVTIVGGIAFLGFGFAFTNAREWVEDQSTVNRATLHLAPLIGVWMVLVYAAWSARWQNKVPEMASVKAGHA